MDRSRTRLVAAVLLVGLLGVAAAWLLLNRPTHDAAADEPDPGPPADRFQTLWGEAGDNLVLPDEYAYLDSSDANAIRSLSEKTPVHFEGYYFPDADNGHWCAVSNDDTFIAKVVEDGTATILMGDGGCSLDALDPTNAAVVGNLDTETWTTGADLMGGEQMKPWGTHPVITEPASNTVLNAAVSANEAIMLDFAAHGFVATGSAADDVLDDADLPRHIRVRDFTVTGPVSDAAFTFCVVNDHTGDWAVFDSTQGGVTTSGAHADDLDTACAKGGA